MTEIMNWIMTAPWQHVLLGGIFLLIVIKGIVD